MRPISHPRLFTLSAAFTVLALTASVLGQAHPAFAQQNSDTNTPPHFTISATTINVLWSDYDEADVNIGSPFVATDAEGDDFSYSVREDNSDDYFQIDTSGQLKTTDNALPDPASSGGNKDEYSISVRVCKLGTVNYLPSRCDYIGVTINVIKSKAAIRYPVIAGHGGLEHPEGIEGVTTYTAFAPEDKNVGWVLSGLANDNDGDLFTIGQSDGVLRFKEAPDYDPAGDNSYDLTVSAYTGKNEQAWFNVKVTVVGDGNSPHFDGETDSRTVAENTAAGVDIGEPLTATDNDDSTLTYSLDGDDAASFDIDSTSGQLQTKAALDFETKASYTVTVLVSDGKNAAGDADTSTDDEITVTINVTDVNEAPTFDEAIPTRAIDENTVAGVDIGAPVAATDPDNGDTLTYTLGGADAASLDIVSTSGQLQTKAALDFEAKASYTLTVLVSDGKDAEGAADPATDDEITVTINVTDVNEAPTFDEAIPTRAIDENTVAGVGIGAPVAATDPDNGDTLTYTLGGTDAASFGIVSTSGQLQTKAALDKETKASYTVTVSVSDGKNASGAVDTTPDATITVTITVTDVNDAPSFDEETATRAIAENTGAGVDIGLPLTATDDDGDVLAYYLGASAAAFFYIVPTSGQLQTKVPLNHEATVRYSMRVSVRDSKDADGNADTDADDEITVNITVTDVNEAPEFPAATDSRTVAENTGAGEAIGAPVAAIDQDGDPLTYSLDPTDAASFDIVPTTGQLRTKAALNHEATDSYTVTVSVRDSKDGSGAADTVTDDTITVTINVTGVNEAPTFDEEMPTRDIAENTEAGQDIGDPVAATDQDNGDTLTYTLGGTDAASFGIVSTSGQLQTKAALDKETKASYTVTVSVRDSKDADGNSDGVTDATVTVAITVTNVNEAPTFGGEKSTRANAKNTVEDKAIPTRAIAENTAADEPIGEPITATDPEGDSLTYTLGGTDAASFGIVPTSGQLLTKVALDHETKASYTVTVSVSDGKDANGDSDQAVDDTTSVTITVTDVNETPEFPAATDTREVAENTVAGQNIGAAVAATDPDDGDTLTYTLGGTDAASFGIDSTSGQLQTKTALDKEAKASYTVTVSVSDSKDAAGDADMVTDDTITVTITVTDVNDASEFPAALDSRTVPENTVAGVDIGLPVAATDDEDDTLTYTLGGTDAPRFTIDSGTGQIRVGIGTTLDHETKDSYTVTVLVSDGKDADGNPDTDMAPDGTTTVTITVTDVNEDPEFPAATATRTIRETTVVGRNIGAPVAATDPDDGDTLIYTLGGTDVASFDIVSTSGQLRTQVPLDRETKDSYTVTVSVSDGNPDTATDATVTVTINVTAAPAPPPPPRPSGGGGGGGGGAPSNRRPVFTEGAQTTRSIAENMPAEANIGDPVAATDSNRGDTLTYSLRGTDAASFDVDTATGQLLTKVALDYETKASYSVIVRVSDREDQDHITVAISVTNEDEAGTVALSSPGPEVGVALTATLTDPDGGVTGVTWVWARSSDLSAWTAIRGAASNSYTPVDADKGGYLRVTVSYADGHGLGKSALATSAALPSNTAPRFPGVGRDANGGWNGGIERNVAENTAEGEPVGEPVVAMDPEDGALTCVLGGADAAMFTIEPDTGQIRVGAGTELDYEGERNIYNVAVIATDSLGLSATVPVVIRVTDVDLGPYDVNKNEVIERSEAIAAVVDYFADRITKEEAIGVVQLYFAS